MSERVKELVESIKSLTGEDSERWHKKIIDGIKLEGGQWAILYKLNPDDQMFNLLNEGDGYWREKFDTLELLIQELESKEYNLLIGKLRSEVYGKARQLESNTDGEKLISEVFEMRLYKRYGFTKDLNKAIWLAEYCFGGWSLYPTGTYFSIGYEAIVGDFHFSDESNPALAICKACYAQHLWNGIEKPDEKKPAPRKSMDEIMKGLHDSIFNGMMENLKEDLLPPPDFLIVPFMEDDEITPPSPN